jgi:hypothetical protein
MDEKKTRLMKLIEHWAEHNDEHALRFRDSSAEAEEMGLKIVSEELKEAYSEAIIVSEHLRKALEEIKEGEE